jgi:hypothetical protein
LVCVVPMAQAEDSAGIEYRDAPPSPTGTQIPTHSGPPATTSNKTGGAQAPGGSTNSNGESTEGNSGAGGGAGANGGGGQGNSGGGQGGSGNGQGNPGGGPGASNLSNAQSVGNPTGADSGGSSPLVPILIAIAAVMAAAIAAVVIRQRRQRRGPDAHVSPEAS